MAKRIKNSPVGVVYNDGKAVGLSLNGTDFMSNNEWTVVSSRPLKPGNARSDAQQFTSRTLCVLPCDVSALKLVYANFYNRTTGNGECPFPNFIQIRASIFPATTIGNESTPFAGYDVLFRGRQIKVMGRGVITETDPLYLALPKGTPFYIKTWVSMEIPDAPAAPTLGTASTGGILTNNTFKVAVTIVYPNDNLESQVSAGTSITLAGGTSTQKIDVTAPTAVVGALGYRVWVTASGGAEPYYDAGCGIVPFSRNAVVYGPPNIAANWDTAEIVLPSTPKLFPVSYAGLLGGTSAGGSNTGEGSISGYDTTQATGIAIGGSAGQFASYGPISILGLTNGAKPSCAVVGDSIADGAGDSGHGGVSGFISRGIQKQFGRKYDPTIVPEVGLVTVSQGSETPTRTADGRFNRRLQIASMARSIICDHSTNSLASGSPFVANYVLISADRFLNLGKRYWHTTCTPRHSSTDGFISIANYTQTSSQTESARRQVNAWLRSQSGSAQVDNEIPFRVSASTVTPSFDYYGPANGTITQFAPRQMFIQGSETVFVNGVRKFVTTDYTYINPLSVDGVTYTQAISFGVAPLANSLVTISYKKIPGIRVMRPTIGIFDSAALVEVNPSGVLDIEGGWWPANAQTFQSGILATAVTANSLTASSLNMTIDQYRGYTVTVTADSVTPAAVGQSLCVKYNTASTFTFASNWTTQPSTSAVFSINDVATADGLHPATRMHIAESFAIDPTLL